MIYNGLYYEVKGKGDPIILIHGIGGTHEMFSPQVEVLSRFAKTIAIDLKGHGQSECVKTTHYLDVHCQSILDLMDHLSIKKATFIGLSYGGIVTQEIATRYPDKVKKMVLMDTYGDVFPRTGKQIPLAFFGLFLIISSLLPYKMLGPFFKQYEKWELAHETMLYNYQIRNKSHMMIQLVEVIGKSYLKKLQTLQTPTLVIVGDAVSSVVEKSLEIYKNTPNSELLLVKNAMDPSNLCEPDKVNEAIVTFLRQKKKKLII